MALLFKQYRIYFIITIMATSLCFAQQELSVNDFKFDGELGSQGAKISKLGKNYFKINLGHAPYHDNWSNMLQFQITGNAKGNTLRLDVEFDHPEAHYVFNSYAYSWSYDQENWQPIQWKQYCPTKYMDVLVFPAFTKDTVWFGHQVPVSFEQIESMIKQWEKNQFVTVHTLGKSLGGKNLYRVTVTNSNATGKKWVHYFSNQHPGEHNSQWRMIAMMEWLLSDEGNAYLDKSINHFVFMMSPDAPANGWYRVNAEGVDMNRSYRLEGSNKDEQAHEAFIFQKDFEEIMQSPNPVTDIWAMHTWQGVVESIIIPGPEMGTELGPWTDLREIIIKNDTELLAEPLRKQDYNKDIATHWNHGPYGQFGITSILCEGGGSFYTKAENKKSGVLLIKSIAEYYK